MVRLALISDIHHGRPASNGRGCRIEEEFQSFIEWIGKKSPDLVVEMGDRTSGKLREEDEAYMMEVARCFQSIPEPKIHLMGNHDADFFSYAENGAFVGQPMISRSLDLGGFHLIFWQPDVWLNSSEQAMAGPSSKDLEWLRADLCSTELKTIIFSHVPLNATSHTVNPYFDLHKAVCWGFYERQADIQKAIRDGNNVVACINGHAHLPAWSRLDGVHYITLPAYGEFMATWPDVSAAFTELVLDENGMMIRFLGRDPMEFEFHFKNRGQHWLTV